MRNESAADGSPNQVLAMAGAKVNSRIPSGTEVPRPYIHPERMIAQNGCFSSETSRVTASEMPAEEKVSAKEKTVMTRLANPMPAEPSVLFK